MVVVVVVNFFFTTVFSLFIFFLEFRKVFYQDALIYLNFDLEGDITDVQGHLHSLKLEGTYMEPSPINYARCVNEQTFNIGTIGSDCLLTLNGCDAGFLVSFWFYIDHNNHASNVTFFQMSKLIITASFGTNENDPGFVIGQLKWDSDSMLCTADIVVPFKAWAYMHIGVQSSQIYWRVNSLTGTKDCVTFEHNVSSSDPTLAFGNLSSMCIDEILVQQLNNATEKENVVGKMVDIYQSIIKYVGGKNLFNFL